MFDPDEIKGNLLNELIQHLMEAKDPNEGQHDSSADPMSAASHDPSDKGADPAALLDALKGKDDSGQDDDQSDDPKAKLEMLAVSAKPDADEPDEDDMKKPLSPMDIMAMKKKHMGL